MTTRDELHELVKSRLGTGATYTHCLACEACMRALAQVWGEDDTLWGMAGLVHDMDLDVCGDDLSKHTLVAADVLRQMGVDEKVVLAVLGHNDKAPRLTRMERALWVVDPATGMITASALIRPSRSTRDLDVPSIKKRMKDKRFAATVRREQIAACDSELGLSLDQFLEICLKAMNDIRDQLQLDG